MEIEKIQEAIEHAKSVTLILRENFEEQEVLIREALRIFFQNKSLPVYLFPETPEEIKNKWFPFLNNQKNLFLFNEISVRFPKNSFHVKEIGYEENEEFLTLKILAGNNGIEKGNVVFDSRSAPVDLLICLGSVNINSDYFRKKISLSELEEEKIIFLLPDDKTLSEKIFEIIQTVEKELLEKNNIPDLLFASLFLETNNFKKKITEGSLNMAHCLLSLGANKNLINETTKKDLSFPFVQILGRTLARTRLNESLKSNWTFISKMDFEKTGIENADFSLIRRIINEIMEIVPRQPVFVILWEDKENSIWAMLKTEKEEKDAIGPYKSFLEAELKIQQMLKETI